mmetsp:Transcript_4577/g.11066  ORF Transcript_4577/g.11066 Transcript_4577/m.11066 type:complete len:113 (-) Transcript_4577:2627-2965(-)
MWMPRFCPPVELCRDLMDDEVPDPEPFSSDPSLRGPQDEVSGSELPTVVVVKDALDDVIAVLLLLFKGLLLGAWWSGELPRTTDSWLLWCARRCGIKVGDGPRGAGGEAAPA